MSKGPTKAQLALAEAREWIEASKMEVRRCEAVLTEAESRLEMNERLYALLEKTFTRQPGKVMTKKASKKSSKSAGKSARASSLQQQIQGRARVSGSYTDENGCVHQFKENGGKFCGSAEDSAIHDPSGGYSGYHPYEPPTEQAASASGRD